MPLQKSFSEQNQRFKRAPWQKSRSCTGLAQQPDAAKHAGLVSDVTKKKLEKFQYKPPLAGADQQTALGPPQQSKIPVGVDVVAIDDDNKENDYHLAPSSAPAPPAGPYRSPTAPQAAPSANITTPIARLAWEDLMGLSSYPNEDEEDVSPGDRLTWHNDKWATAKPPSARRGKKRARSTSPLSSSPANPAVKTPSVTVKELRDAVRPSHADPSLDLWDRFSLTKASSSTPIGLRNPALAHLMVSSSPRPTNDGIVGPQTGSKLRRATSCGSNWPKRRKIERPDDESPTTRPVAKRGNSKDSMVSALLETVTEEITKSSVLRAGRRRSSQSPSPVKGANYRRAAASPTTPRLAVGMRADSRTTVASETPVARLPTTQESTSDYGDDDFDDDTLMGLDAGLVGMDPANVLDDEIPHNKAKQDASSDEFGDLDDDLFADAADLAMDIQSRTPSQNPAPSNKQAALDAHGSNANGQGGDEDEWFGDDAFGGDVDFEEVELAATQSAKPARGAGAPLNAGQKPKAIQRFLVTKVLPSSSDDSITETVLVVLPEGATSTKTVHLRGDWIETPVVAQSYVHIIGAFDESGKCVIDNQQNMVILHPDQLISATVVADSFGCMRRAVLQDRVKATSDASPALVYGTLLHEIFQEALMANRWDPAFLRTTVDKAIGKHMEELYTIKVQIADAREHLLSKTGGLRYWAAAFVSAYPKPDAVISGRGGEKLNICISKLLDVEEHVWSPMYGLKGNIDATVQVTMKEGSSRRTLTVPFELKTGRSENTSHQAQTILYNLLLSDRYDVEILYGLLHYMETGRTLRIPTIRHELRHLIMQRNQLACYIWERSVQLPPMKRDKNSCGRCYAQSSCFTYHKLADDGDGETSAMDDKFEDAVKHLTPKHKEFFLKWEDLLTKEEKQSQKLRRELWTMVSAVRERLGRCFGNVIMEDGSASEDKGSAKINRFHYAFIKEHPDANFSFADSQLAVGEPIVVSDEKGHFALALGYVTSVRRQRIEVAVDRRLHNARIRRSGFDEATNQVFTSIMEVPPPGGRLGPSQEKAEQAPVRYRLDKDEFSNGMAVVRNNLVQAMLNGTQGSQQIRRLVVDLEPPAFKAICTPYNIDDGDDGTLNVDQKKAIDKVMTAKDYALVLGMPGTGKTTTIAHIIRALISQKKSVLLTSYTHTAVDNILLKLKSDKIPILRLGAPAKVHAEVREFVTLAAQPKTTFEEIRGAWHDTPVVATTCLGIGHAVFAERTFDYCIVDEASQITLPICMGPIRMARTFVLVGDHNQLPPLVQNDEAREGGLDVSLFKLLSDTHPSSVVNLEHQYRMSEDVMTLSNTLIYHGRLKCGTEAVRHRRLDVPNPGALRRHHYDAPSSLDHSRPGAPYFCKGQPCWLAELLSPSTSVAFVNTDKIPARERASGNRIVNPGEARVVAQLVEALLTVGVPASEIGVMTHYRSQLALLRHSLRSCANPAAAHVEMHTADRFQGRDKEVIVLSLVRSNDARRIGDLLKDWRRINVAFTRAKSKLLVVGSRLTLQDCGDEEMLARFMGLMESRNWIYDLPEFALEDHLFEEGVSQLSLPVSEARSPEKSPPKKLGVDVLGDKENRRPGPKRAKVTERALLKGRPVLRDIMNEMAGGNIF